MASLLKAQEYATGMSGKWHMGSKPEWGPNHYGFDYSHGSLAGAVGMYDHRYRLNSPFVKTWHRNHEFIEEDGHVTDLTAAESVRWIESHTEEDKPWFFYVPFQAVHVPLVEKDPQWEELNKHFESADRRLYAAAVSHMDWAVGQMMDALGRTGQQQRTLVIFTSDNGAQGYHRGNVYPPPDPKLVDFSSNKPLRGMKGTVYEGGYRVPAIASWPGKLNPHKLTTPMHVSDWLPTIAGLVEYEVEEDPAWDGQDVWPMLTGQNTEPAQRTIYIVWGKHRLREALRHGNLKILRSRDTPWEMYDLEKDPYETTNLAEKMPEKLNELLEVYRLERAKDAE